MHPDPIQRTQVLIVDDRRETRLVLSQLIEAAGFEPHVAATGVEALAIFSDIHPHVVLLDLGMPEMDGFEVCRRIRETPGSADVLIVIISGYEQDEYKSRAIEAGANYYLVKPADSATLIELVRRSGRR